MADKKTTTKASDWSKNSRGRGPAEQVDILAIDVGILQAFEKEREKLPEMKDRLVSVQMSIESAELTLVSSRSSEAASKTLLPALRETETELLRTICEIENKSVENFYKAETAEILEGYRAIQSAPVRVSFMGPPKPDPERAKLIQDYLKIASLYSPVPVPGVQSGPKAAKIACKNCGNRKEFDNVDTNVYICTVCSAQQVVLKTAASYKDVDRVNGATRYTYVRRVHFRDGMNQYQAKQNCTIDKKVYDKLKCELELHGLVDTEYPESDKLNRYKNVTKEHIRIFLQELELPKHYENINLIHYNITGKKPDDIGYLEAKLMSDFDTLTDLYDKRFRHLDRKSFINTQCVLFQLLLKHRHKCEKEDFAILKTVEKKDFYDEIMSQLFEELAWTFLPLV